LTDSRLRKYPAIQKLLVDTIKDFSLQKATITVEQTKRDIKTGALVKTGKDSYTIDYDKREKVDTRIHPIKTPIVKYLEILDKIHDTMYSLTGHKIAKDESEYEQRHIDLTEPYRIEILRGLSPQQKKTLFNDLTLLGDATDSFIDIIENDESLRRAIKEQNEEEQEEEQKKKEKRRRDQ
jgi:hypothetical protein